MPSCQDVKSSWWEERRVLLRLLVTSEGIAVGTTYHDQIVHGANFLLMQYSNLWSSWPSHLYISNLITAKCIQLLTSHYIQFTIITTKISLFNQSPAYITGAPDVAQSRKYDAVRDGRNKRDKSGNLFLKGASNTYYIRPSIDKVET